MTATLRVERLHTRAPATQAVTARLAAEALVGQVDPALPGLPPQSVLLLRRLSLALPAGALVHWSDLHLRLDFAARAEARLVDAARRARWPAREARLADAEAVLFADEAELLACLARDAAAGRLQHWWWRLWLGRSHPQWQVAFMERPQAALAARRTLQAWGLAGWVEARLPARLPAARHVPAAAGFAGADVVTPPPDLPGAARGSAGTGAATRADRSTGGSTAADVAPVAGRTPPARMAAGASEGRSMRGACVADDAAVTVGTTAPDGAVAAPPRAPDAPPRPAIARTAAAVAPPDTAAVLPPTASDSPRTAGAVDAPHHGPAAAPRVSVPETTARAPEMRRTTAAATQRQAAALAGWALPAPERAVAAAGAHETGRDGAPGPLRPALPPADATLHAPGTAEAATPKPLATAYGGVFFLVNSLIARGWLADFTQSAERGLRVPPWQLLATVALVLAGPALRRDPLWRWLRQLDSPAPAPRVPPPRSWLRHPRRDGRARARPGVAVQRLARSLREPLARALGLPADQALPLLLLQPARVWATDGELVVVFALQRHPVQVRLAGLDRDPGWLPSAARSLRFVFE